MDVKSLLKVVQSNHKMHLTAFWRFCVLATFSNKSC
jgi:hypothetical protein